VLGEFIAVLSFILPSTLITASTSSSSSQTPSSHSHPTPSSSGPDGDSSELEEGEADESSEQPEYQNYVETQGHVRHHSHGHGGPSQSQSRHVQASQSQQHLGHGLASGSLNPPPSSAASTGSALGPSAGIGGLGEEGENGVKRYWGSGEGQLELSESALQTAWLVFFLLSHLPREFPLILMSLSSCSTTGS
jgi:hypothetical protein